MLVKNSKISDYKIKKIIWCFVVDISATHCAKILGFNRNTINKYYNIFRDHIFEFQTARMVDALKWEVEFDESYFWWNRVKGFHWKKKRWRWTHKQPVFWIFERWGRVYTEIVPNCKKKTLQNIIKGKVAKETVVYTDWWRWYDGLVDVWYNKHFRVIHSKNEFARKWWVHVNWIEAYRSFCKRRLAKFNWVKVNFELHLKESERRYLEDDVELFRQLCRMLKPQKQHRRRK